MEQVISQRIMKAVQAGMTVDQAIDFVLGAGAYQKIASELYDRLRK